MIYDETKEFDVIILGSGLAGSLLATILARHNVRVLMIDKESHPRFAIGEAMTPDTDLMMEILSYQYSVPEIAHLSSFAEICTHISPSSCGVKRSFSFIHHREGEEQTLQESNQVSVNYSSHLFRQDIDHYMVKVAIKYGAKLLEKVKVTDLEIDQQGVQVILEGHPSITANYLVDASGHNSLLGKKFNLREEPTRFKSHSRSIFTHMVGVKNYDDCVQPKGGQKNIIPWHEGTLHHIFHGGWMWVIPFNNHERSTNQICSVGINLDPRIYPKTDLPPEQEFQQFLARFPGIAIQFENAKPIRNWVSTGRLQYSSHSCMGERFFLLPHAAGFLDALFSFGLVNSCTIISPLASRILKAVSKHDFSTDNFADLEPLQQDLLDYNDSIVNCSYISFSNFKLWDAWRRIWLIGTLIRRVKARASKHAKIVAGKGKELFRLTEVDDLERLSPSFEDLGQDFFQESIATIEKVQQGLLSPDAAAEQILALINALDFLPADFIKRIGDPSQRDLVETGPRNLEGEFIGFMLWVKLFAKKEVKKYFPFEIGDFLSLMQKYLSSKVMNQISRLSRPSITGKLQDLET
jgi:FADH2 O2-dependent halogenase